MQREAHYVLVLTAQDALPESFHKTLLQAACTPVVVSEITALPKGAGYGCVMAILDIASTPLWGPQALQQLRQAHPPLPISLLPSLDLSEESGKLLLSCLADLICTSMVNGVLTIGDLSVNPNIPVVWVNGRHKPICRSTWEILLVLISHSPSPLSKKALVRLIGKPDESDSQFIEGRLSNLRKFLTGTQARLVMIRNVGYLIQADPN